MKDISAMAVKVSAECMAILCSHWLCQTHIYQTCGDMKKKKEMVIVWENGWKKNVKGRKETEDGPQNMSEIPERE